MDLSTQFSEEEFILWETDDEKNQKNSRPKEF